MRAAWMLPLLFASGCFDDGSWPTPTPTGERQAPGYHLTVGHTLGFDTRFDGFLVESDKPGQFSISWIENSAGQDLFEGTIAVDGAIDRGGTFVHSGEEAIAFDSDSQLSFRSTPGANLHGVDVAAPSGVIYLDARINQVHDGVTVEFSTSAFDKDWLSWSSAVDPVAFSTN